MTEKRTFSLLLATAFLMILGSDWIDGARQLFIITVEGTTTDTF